MLNIAIVDGVHFLLTDWAHEEGCVSELDDTAAMECVPLAEAEVDVLGFPDRYIPIARGDLLAATPEEPVATVVFSMVNPFNFDGE